MTRFDWRPATVVANQWAATEMFALRLLPEEWIPHRPGQHYEIRFPGERLSRKFSIASNPEAEGAIEFGIQLLPTGMLSSRLAQCRRGDRLEVRGPTGVAFAWDAGQTGPLVLIGAGAGITPLVSMYEHLRAVGDSRTVAFVLSAKAPDRVFHYERYRHALTTRFTSTEPRIDFPFLRSTLAPVLDVSGAQARVCGPPPFMSAVVDHLLALGVHPDRIRSEAFV